MIKSEDYINGYHPNHRYLLLCHLEQLRHLARHGHPMYRREARDMIKAAQRVLAEFRANR